MWSDYKDDTKTIINNLPPKEDDKKENEEDSKQGNGDGKSTGTGDPKKQEQNDQGDSDTGNH